jgi:hypothetical protein
MKKNQEAEMEKSQLKVGEKYLYKPSGDAGERVVLVKKILGVTTVIIDDLVFGYKNMAVLIDWFLRNAKEIK